MIKPKPKKCKGTGDCKGHGCGKEHIQRKYGLCHTCFHEWKTSFSGSKWIEKNRLKLSKDYTINKVSKKRKIENLKYSVLRTEFLSKKENRICPITKQETTDIHHKWSGKDRSKYFLDTKTWLAVSRKGHIWIHENPKKAREIGYLF